MGSPLPLCGAQVEPGGAGSSAPFPTTEPLSTAQGMPPTRPSNLISRESHVLLGSHWLNSLWPLMGMWNPKTVFCDPRREDCRPAWAPSLSGSGAAPWQGPAAPPRLDPFPRLL